MGGICGLIRFPERTIPAGASVSGRRLPWKCGCTGIGADEGE
jgi:hypothetical protein